MEGLGSGTHMSIADLQETDFIVLSEDFSRYLLSNDGTRMKAKIVLKKVFFSPLKTQEGYPHQTAFDSQNVVVAMVPQELKRPPSQSFDANRDPRSEMKFEEQEIKWQEYMTSTGFKIRIKPVVVKVFKYTDKYNEYGEPIYYVSMQSITSIDKIETTT